MAVLASPVIVTFTAGADLSNAQWRFVKMGTADGTVVQADANSRVIGVLTNKPKLGEPAAVAVAGVVKVEAGGAITRGQLVGANAAGQAIPATAPGATWGGAIEHVAGIALENATAGQLVEILLSQFSYGR